MTRLPLAASPTKPGARNSPANVNVLDAHNDAQIDRCHRMLEQDAAVQNAGVQNAGVYNASVYNAFCTDAGVSNAGVYMQVYIL